MNANFGIILKKREREHLLSSLPRETRTWGEETVEVGEVQYAYAPLDDVAFQIYPVTPFILDRLPDSLKSEELEYAWISGSGLESYELLLQGEQTTPEQSCVFESGLTRLVGDLSGCAILFAPEGDRLGKFITCSSDEVISILRESIMHLTTSEGFLATIGVAR